GRGGVGPDAPVQAVRNALDAGPAAPSELGLAAAEGISGALARDMERPLRGHLLAVAIDGGILRPDLAPVALQFLTHHHGVGGPHTLAELRLGDADRHSLVGRDHDPGVDLLDRGLDGPGGALWMDDLGQRILRHPEPDDQRARRSSRARQKIAAGQAYHIGVAVVHRISLPHVGSLEATSRIAWRTRW